MSACLSFNCRPRFVAIIMAVLFPQIERLFQTVPALIRAVVEAATAAFPILSGMERRLAAIWPAVDEFGTASAHHVSHHSPSFRLRAALTINMASAMPKQSDAILRTSTGLMPS